MTQYSVGWLSIAATNARFASLHGLSVVPVPLSTTPVPLRKARARHERASAMGRKSGGLPSAARRRALRSGCDSLNASLRPPLHFPRSPTADRSQIIRIRGQGAEFANQ